MKWPDLLQIVAEEPVFSSSLLMAGRAAKADIQKQLSRWVKAGKLVQIRRGLYALSEPYRKVQPHPFLIANRLKRPSYVSLESALAYHGLIPEHVPKITSVTTTRPASYDTPLGSYGFRHIQKKRFGAFHRVQVAPGQYAFLAGPERSLLDLIYLTPRADTPSYLTELRLENLESLDVALLLEQAVSAGSAKLRRAAEYVSRLARGDTHYEEL